MERLNGRTAIITGASSGIGLATARLFASEGADLILIARNGERLESALQQIARTAPDAAARAFTADIAHQAELPQVFAALAEDGIKADVLFANAALVRLAAIADTDDVLLEEVVSTNLVGTFRTIRSALGLLSPGASVIVTTSWFNRIGYPGSAALAMTKAAVRSLARVAAAELAPQGIRVNALSPGAVATPLWGSLGLDQDTLDEAAADITVQIPLGRWADADDVARAALFLASDDSSYLTGTELQVDGGMRQV